MDQKCHRKIYDKLTEEDRQILELDFGNNPDKLRGEYLDMYEGVQSEVISTARFDENSDLRTTHFKKKVLLLCSTARPDGFSSTLQLYPRQGTHPTLV